MISMLEQTGELLSHVLYRDHPVCCMHADAAVVAEPESPLEDSTEGVPEGVEIGGPEVDERLLESASEGESGSDDLFKKDSSPEGGEEEEEEDGERSRVEEGSSMGAVQERVKEVSA